MLKAFLGILLLFLIYPVYGQKIQKSAERLSPLLAEKIRKVNPEDSINALIFFAHLLQPVKARIISTHISSSSAMVRIRADVLTEMVEKGAILFADLYIRPREELTSGTLDIRTNRINQSHHAFPDITGTGINASIKENRFDSTDIDYANRYFSSGLSAPNATMHAAAMATALAGAGNSSPNATGVAYGSKITSSNFANLLPDADSVFRKYNISIQNHSYGTIIQNYYGIEAAAYDAQAINTPSLLHIFSSGNSGTASSTSGVYNGIPGFANLTANFKWSKNTVSVGATDSLYNIAALSSRGPAPDGRLKPELVAFGEDGSSGAAAIVSGTAALVQQAYYQAKQKLPSSALVKAILVNSADDIGKKGPEFESGYGSLNACKAVKTLKEGKYFEDAIAQNDFKTFPLSVPSNTAGVKITLAWTDPAAVPNAAKALVNDIDLVVKNVVTGAEYYPWVLNNFPKADSLQLPAKKGIDSLNNLEQVTIEHPPAGNYVIIVRGSKITGSQAFSFAYQLEAADFFEWTFPLKNEQLEAGKENILRWQTSITGTGKIEWSPGGNLWTTITANADLSKGYFKWNAPFQFTTGNLRMQLPGLQVNVSDSFLMSTAPIPGVAFNCPDSFMLYWNRLPVSEYKLFRFEVGSMKEFRNVADSFLVLPKAANPYLHYSVAPVVSGKTGLRSYAINYPNITVGCYITSFYLQLQDEKRASFMALLGSLYGVQSIEFQKLKNQVFETLTRISAPAITSFEFTDSTLVKGQNRYRLQITLKNGQVIYSNVEIAYHFGAGEFLVYPNPVKQDQNLNLVMQTPARLDIAIFNSAGMVVKEMRLKDFLSQVPLTGLPKGVYFIRGNTNEGSSFVQKLVIY